MATNDYRAFLTGSYAYGTPTPDSDIDLVVFVSELDLDRLREMADRDDSDPNLEEYYIAAGGFPLRFGKLNLLCVTDELRYRCWVRGTEALKRRKPVTRDFAVEHLRRVRREAGFHVKDGPTHPADEEIPF